MTLLTYSVPGVTCDMCKQAIEGELAKLPGVVEATVDLASKTVSVQGEVSDEDVRAAIDEAGYETA